WRVGLRARHEGAESMSSGKLSAFEAHRRLASQSRFDLLRLVPSVHARPPAANVLTIRLVLSSKFLPERRLFIEDYEQMHAESNGCDSGDRKQVGMAEDNPKADPARCEPQVHGIA